MGVYFGATEITGLYFGNTEIAGLYFGDTEIWAALAEYDGTLPAQYSANGSALADYRIYGAAGGVGDDRGTAYGYAIPMAVQGDVYIDKNDGLYGYEIVASGSLIRQNNLWWVSGYIPVVQGATYTGVNTGNDILVYREIGETATGAGSFQNGYTVPRDVHYIRINAQISLIDSITISVKYPSISIYIGSSPLGEGEYVDYGEGKIYRMSGGVLTPTDPPVPLPQLPTVDGVTITDYAGQSAAVPSRFYAKYRKG